MQVKAPWTIEQVTALNEWQQRMDVHPFTCGGPNEGDHPTKELIASSEGWYCPHCTYTQDWAHDFMMVCS